MNHSAEHLLKRLLVISVVVRRQILGTSAPLKSSLSVTFATKKTPSFEEGKIAIQISKMGLK